jgi:precorrin-2 methylase
LIEETARHVDNLVFVKCAHRLKQLVPVLEYAGFAEDATVALVRRCGMPEEEVRVGSLGELENWVIPEDYFSMAIIKRTPFTLEKEDGEA